MRTVLTQVLMLTALAGQLFGIDLPSSVPLVRFESAYTSDHLYDNGRTERASFGEFVNTGHISRGIGRWNTSLVIRHVRPQGDMTYYRADNLDLRITPPETHIDGHLSIHAPDDIVSSGLWWQNGRDDRGEFGITGHVSLSPILRVGYEKSSRHPMSYLTNISYQGEGGVLGWVAPASVTTYSAELMPRENWSIFWRETGANFHIQPDDRAITASTGYVATLDGNFDDDRIGIAFESIDGFGFSGYRRIISTDLRLLGFNDGLRFAHFGIVEFSAELWSLNLTFESIQIGLQRGKADGALAGSIEAWPFLDGLARFLGERRHLIGSGHVKWKTADLSKRFSLSKNVDLMPALLYVHVRPDISYRTWRPLFLGFGVDDLRQDQLNIQSAHLIRLDLSPSINFGRIKILAKASQWIPVSIRKRSDGAGESPAPSPIPTVDESSSPHQGFGFSFSLLYTM